MSRNGSGTYNLPAGNPVVTGTVISSTWANNTLADMATAITGSIAADGQTPITGALTGTSGTVAFAGVGQTRIPAGTSAQRSASPQDGMIRYNTDLMQYEGYKNGAWSIFGNGAGGTLFSDTITATQGQTVVDTPTGFVLGGDNLSVYVNGSRQIYNVNYTETSTTQITFSTGLNVGDLVNYTIGASTSLSVNASSVLYNEGGTGAVNRNVEQKLQESVSVKDFGAIGDGTTDDSTAFANAVATGKSIFVPKGTYKASFDLGDSQEIYGEGARITFLIPATSATYVIRINAVSVAKQNCYIHDLGLKNPNSVANCVGILFNGTDVNTINDNHKLKNIYITGLNIGIKVLGRLISSSFANVEVYATTNCFNVSTDTANAAFILNNFNECIFAGSNAESMKIVGLNVTNTFTSCNFQSANLSNVAGVAAVYVEDSQMIVFSGCYFENNGTGVAVNTGNYAVNSFGLKFAGQYCFEPTVENCWLVSSGVLIAFLATVGGIGGNVKGNQFSPLTNGWDIYVASATNSNNSAPVSIDANNYFVGVTSIPVDGNGQFNGCVRQNSTSRYIATAGAQPTIDLRNQNKIITNNAIGTTINSISNAFAGMELWIYNYGAGNTVIDGSLTSTGSPVTLTQSQKALFTVGGFPYTGKLIQFI
jgi:hypothetical protein